MTMFGTRVSPGNVTVGRDVGPVGRWARGVSGVLGLSYGIAGFFIGTSPATGSAIAGTLAALVLVAAYYLVVQWLLGERLFARANPWFGTTIMLGSLGVFTAPFMPDAVSRAASLYVGAMLIVNAIIGYGGCEVAAPATLLFRRRYVIYCPWNAVDAAERPLHRLGVGPAGRIVAVGTAVLGVYFVLGRDILARLQVPDPISPTWALLLVVPAGYLAYRGARSWRQGGGWSEVRVLAVGAGSLLLLAAYLAQLVPQGLVWPVVMVVGLAYAVGRVIVAAVRRRAADPATQPGTGRGPS